MKTVKLKICQNEACFTKKITKITKIKSDQRD